MHRNLKPDNIFIDGMGIVKIGDFTTTRMLDIPLQAYTPEDPKERERSGREMRRLWYRAPELILRDEIYGPKVDIWSVGCLLAEAATGKALFQSDSEIDHLFRTFRLIGTPNASSWPEALLMRNFSPKFPVYPSFSFAQVARAVCCGSVTDQEALLTQAKPDRLDIMQNLLGIASCLGADGMLVASRMITCPPAWRAGADAVLNSPFFADGFADDCAEPHALTKKWLQGDVSLPDLIPEFEALAVQCEAPCTPRSRRERRVRHDDTPSAVLAGNDLHDHHAMQSGLDGKDIPDALIPSLDRLIPPCMVWSIFDVMRRKECGRAGKLRYASINGETNDVALPLALPKGFDSSHRAVMVDFMIGLASNLSLTDYTLHIAVSVADRYMSNQEGPISTERMHVIGASCLKVSDVFAEQSKEYYKQENTIEYAEATLHHATPAQMLSCEKDVLPKVEFDLQQPTVHWFLQCYLVYARFTALGRVAKTSSFIADLILLDYDLLVYGPSLRAQCCILLAAFLVQSALADEENSQEQLDMVESDVLQGSALTNQETRLRVPNLDHWDEHARNNVCSRNNAVDAAMCLQAVVRTLVVNRREWKSAKLVAVENKHATNMRMLNYPEMFPVSKLVRYILPDQR
jgi:hypothetical protein